MTDRENLCELLFEAIDKARKFCHTRESCRECEYAIHGTRCLETYWVDHLLAHGVTVREPGHWIDMQEDEATDGMWRCSVCGSDRYFDVMTPEECGCYYCPNCGAKMEGNNETDRC